MDRPLRLARRLSLLGACGLCAACGRAAAPAPAPPPPAPRAEPVEPSRHTFAYRPGRYIYEHTSTAAVTLRGDTMRTPEDLHTLATITYAIARDGSARLRVAGSVDTFAVTGGVRTGGAIQRLAAPAQFVATIETLTGRLTFGSPLPSDCASPVGAALAVARDVLVPLPPVVAAGSSWTDSSATQLCRGGVLVTRRATHRYTVQGDDTFRGAPAIRVARQSDLVFEGTGGATAAGATLTGRGTATATVYVDPAGRLLGDTTESAAELTLAANGRSQTFVQKVTGRTALRLDR